MQTMALRQLLGVTCLTCLFLSSSLGVYGHPDYSRGESPFYIYPEILTESERHVKPQDSFRNPEGHRTSGINAAATPSRSHDLNSKGVLAPQTTHPSDQPLLNAGTVFLERPRPLHKISLEDKGMLFANTSAPSSMATFTPTRAGSLNSTNRFDHVLGTSRGGSIASRGSSASASTSTVASRVVRLSDARSDRALASGRNESPTSTRSLHSPIASLASASSIIPKLNLGSAINGSKNSSANSNNMAIASGIGESPRLVEFLDSIKNRTESRIKLSPSLRPRPVEIRPARFPFSRLGLGSHATPGVLISMIPLSTATGSQGNSALRNYLAPLNKTRLGGINSRKVKPHRPSAGFSLPGFNIPTFNRTGHHLHVISGVQNATNCSGLVTSTAHVVYEMVTSTILVNETKTLSPNATTPLPVFITPPPACGIITAPCEGAYCPPSSSPVNGHPKEQPQPEHPLSTSTSTLLVTKKTAAIVQQLSAVGNLFGPSTPTPQAGPAQPNSNNQQSTGQNSGPSNADMSTQSDGSSPPESDGADVPMSQQNPTESNSPSTIPTSQSSDSQKPGVGSDEGQSTENNDQTASNGNELHGAASNHGDASINSDSSSNRDNSNSGNANLAGGTSSNGKVSNNGGALNEEGPSTNGATSNSGSTKAGGDASNNGDASNGESSSSGDSSSNQVDTSSQGDASNNENGLSHGQSSAPEAGNGADSHGNQHIPSMVMAGNLPISVISNAVIFGSHTVQAGSPPTTIVTSGRTIAIRPSQIVAQGKTFPIEAAVTPPPAKSATIGNVPILLRPQDVAIGSENFEHGSLATSITYHGQTYSWDASHLIGAGVTIAFPSVDSAPRVTAGGQVFSVYSSYLKAPGGRNVPLPHEATTSPFVYKGKTFSLNPSQIIAPDTSITLPPPRKITPFVYIDHTVAVDNSQFIARSTTIPLSSGTGTVTYNGQILTIKPSEVIGPSTTIALSSPDDSAASPTAVTTGGLTFSIGPSAAVVGSSTYSLIPGKAPATIMTHGEAVLVGSNGVQFKNIHVPLPTITPSFSAIIEGDLVFSIAPSEVVVGGHTDTIHSEMTPITTTVDGHTISIGPKGVGLASTTIPLPMPRPSFSMTTEADITFSVAPSEVVVKGKTYFIVSNKVPITTTINGQTMTIGPKGIRIDGTTVNLPVIQTPKSVTATGLSFLVGATDAVISGTTYAVGSGAPFQTVVMGSQTMEMGSAGIMLPSTTISPEQTPVAVTAGGLTFSMDSTEAVVNGTTYAIGSGAVAKTMMEGSISMVLGTDGIILPSTTIRPWSNAASTGFSSIMGTSGASPADNTTRPLTPIATGKEKKDAGGSLTRVSNSGILLGLLVGNLILGLGLI